jgi:CTP:phosphocholine cytidylyltransferase-like protein
MTVASVLSLLLAIFKAVPTIEIWWERLVVEYVKFSKLKIAKENKAAIIEALKSDDQRGLEDEEHSGIPSGVGTIRTTLPNIVRKP